MPNHPKPVRFVPGLKIRVHSQGRLELRQGQLLAQSRHLHAVSQNVERPYRVQLLADAIKQHLFRGCPVALPELLPGLRLRGLDPRHQVRREKRSAAIVGACGDILVKPAARPEVGADLVLELDFLVQTHGVSRALSGVGSTNPRTSILPVTAAEMRAERRSLRRVMARWAWDTSASIPSAS